MAQTERRPAAARSARTRAAALTAMTPADRNRVVDLVRVVGLLVVVLGHWVMQGLWVDDDGVLRRAGLLQLAPWTHPYTWLLQVIPLFFLVGGYVNALSWSQARDRGTAYGEWLAARTSRLARPLLPLLAFWVVAAPGASHVGLGGDWLRIAGNASLVPTWFLGVYVVVVALTPLTHAWWRRWGLGSVVAGVAVAALVDVVGLGIGGDRGLAVSAVNLLVVWVTVHQVGYAWRAGVLGGPAHRGRAWVLLLGGLAAAVLLVWWGPYGVSMVGVSGYGVDNASPPRVTLLLVGLAQAGGVLLLEPLLARVAARPGIWQLTVVVGSRMMTIYLWHLTAFGLLAALSLWLGGAQMHHLPGTQAWWWTRPPWFLALAATTLVLVLLLGRYEPRRAGRAVRAGAGLALLEVLVICVVVGVLSSQGVRDSDGRPSWMWQAGGLAVLGLLTLRLDLRPGRPSDG